MSNTNRNITISDFGNICRTCLSTNNLQHIYEKSFTSLCVADLLMSCTSVKFAEDDGLPEKVCTNCIYAINQAYSFVKNCETTDTILRQCVKVETELRNDLSKFQKIESIIRGEKETNIEIKSEIVLPNLPGTVQEVSRDCAFVKNIKQEEGSIIEFKTEFIVSNLLQTVEEVKDNEIVKQSEYEEYARKIKQEEDANIENIEDECDEAYDDVANGCFEEKDEDQDSHSKVNNILDLVGDLIGMDQTQCLSPPKKRRAKHFSVEDKKQILNIFKVCCEQNPNNNKTENVAFTAKAAGICVASVHKILREYNKEHRLEPPKVYYRKRAVLDNINDLTKSKLRRLVHSFLERNEPPTINKIMAALHEDEDMPHLKRSTLRYLLKEI